MKRRPTAAAHCGSLRWVRRLPDHNRAFRIVRLFRRREPVYVAFDVVSVEGADVRGMPLKDRRAILDRVAQRHGMQKSDLFFGCGKSLFKAMCEHDLEGIIAKKLDDPYDPDRTRW